MSIVKQRLLIFVYSFIVYLIFTSHLLISEEFYSQILVKTNQSNYSKIVQLLNQKFDHENVKKAEHFKFRLIANKFEIEDLKNNYIDFEYEIKDLNSYLIIESKKQDELFEKSKKSIKLDVPNFKFGTLGGYFTLNEIYSNFDQMIKLYPESIRIDTIGYTFEKRPLIAYIFNFNKTSKAKPQILLTALHHAREPGSALALIYSMWHLLEQYSNNESEIVYLLNNREIVIVPCLNPDGYSFNQSNGPSPSQMMWRKNRKFLKLVDSDSLFGVDINRNYGPKEYWDYPTNGSSTDIKTEIYRGEKEFSENESQAIRNLCIKKDFRIGLNFHTWGNLLVTPLGMLSENIKDSTFFQNFGISVNYKNHFVYGKDFLTVGYNTRGTSDDWMYSNSDKKSFVSMTPELGNENNGFWTFNRDTMLLNSKNADMIINQALWSASANPEIIDCKIVKINEKVNFQIDVRNIGRSAFKNCKIYIETNELLKLLDTVYIKDLKADDKRILNFPIDFVQNFKSGNDVKFLIHIEGNSDSVFFKKVISRNEIVGDFDDDFIFQSNTIPSAWNLSNWGLENDYLTNNDVLTDSPYQFSAPDSVLDNSYAEYTKSFNSNINYLSQLQFSTRYNIEKTYDQASVLISNDNGNTWKTQKTDRTTIGLGVNGSKQKISGNYFHGHINEWISQKINLIEYKGQKLKLRFEVSCDNTINYQGLFVTDIFIRNFKEITNYLDIEDQESYITQENNIDLKFLFNNGNDVFIEVFDILGNNIISTNVHSFDQLNSLLNVYPKTAYMLQYKYKNKSFVEKFLNLKF